MKMVKQIKPLLKFRLQKNRFAEKLSINVVILNLIIIYKTYADMKFSTWAMRELFYVPRYHRMLDKCFNVQERGLSLGF